MANDQEARTRRRVEMFRQVAAERIGKLNLAWIDVEQKVTDSAAFLREAHTLKGEASLMGFVLTSKVVHAVEDYVKCVRDSGDGFAERDGDLILGGLDLIAQLIGGEPDAPSLEAHAFLARVSDHVGRPFEPTPGPIILPIPASVTPAPVIPTPPPQLISGQTVADSGASKPVPAPILARKASSVRVTSQKIDRLRGMVSDLLLSNVRWRQLTRSVRSMRDSVQVMRHERLLEASLDEAKAWSHLTAQLSHTESRLRDESHDLERFIGELDGMTRELRMVPLASLFDHFPLPLRQLARSLGRQIRLEISGEQIEVDKALLEMLEEPLLHLLRNAVDHGVEPPEERVDCGKPAEATIRITAGMVGQRLSLQVSDDGRGIDVAAVRERALATGLLDPAVASAASEQDILRTIFAAGLTTREEVSEVSGRGIGLNIVLDVVENVGGKVAVRTELGRGTTFDIDVPITVAITRVVLFHVGMGTYALPAASVRSLVLASSTERSEGPDGPHIQFGGVAVPVLDLVQILDEPAAAGRDARIIIAQSGPDLVALDGTSGHLEREVMLKPIGKFFERLQLVSSVVNLEEGALALVFKAAELVLLARSRANRNASNAAPEGRQVAGRIALVADDSPVVRDIVAQALRSHGLRVFLASDGEEALAVFAAQPHVDLVVTDIDMPRLNGIGLVRALRSGETSKNVPVVGISMRGSEAERRNAMEAGMSAYIDKSAFSQSLLWQTIRPFVAKA